MTLSSVVAEAVTTRAHQFLLARPHAALLLPGEVSPSSDLGFQTVDALLRKGAIPSDTIDFLSAEARARYEDRHVWFITKTGRNPFGFVTVGRAENNDLVLRDPSISKFHASFRQTASGWTIVDHGSRNGTTVGDKPIVADTPEPIPDPSAIRFGGLEHRMVFLTTASLHAFALAWHKTAESERRRGKRSHRPGPGRAPTPRP